MLFDILKIIFGSKNDRLLKKYAVTLEKVNLIGLELTELSDLELKNRFFSLKEVFDEKKIVSYFLPYVYAIVREVSFRVLKLKHYDVQILAGIALYEGKIIEVATGEGKTLIATLPVCLFYLYSKSVHVITVNDYLAKRDANWMLPIYNFLNITVGVIYSGMSIYDKKLEYKSDVVYGTCSEFGFDYLRDNIVVSKEERVQSNLIYAIIDEVDSILIDEARTPLIISLPEKSDNKIYFYIKKIAEKLINIDDFILDEKNKQVQLTENGFIKVEELLKKFNLLKFNICLYDVANINLLHDLYAALKALFFFKKDVDYIIKDNSILIIDEHTGRIMDGRRWSDGIHQALEAKENVPIKSENKILASITFQNYFRLYDFLAGMTGTAYTEAVEFSSIYGLDVIVVPTNKKCIRVDNQDLIFLKKDVKFSAVIEDIKKCYFNGQPVLVGTVSIAISEFLSDMLNNFNIKHNVLNAKNHEKESQIIADAGKIKSVTIATNMAGRGTDIILGGKSCSYNYENYSTVISLGGLKVIGTERHESRRIDNQLRGRCGRQGDPGCTQFYLSLEDDLIRMFISDKISFLLKKINISDNDIISNNLISKSVENAQRKVESYNFEIRKQLLEFDDIFNEQRLVFYNYRNFIIFNSDINVMVHELILDVCESFFNKILNVENLNSFDIVKAINFEFFIEFSYSDSFKNIEVLKKSFLDYLLKFYFDRRDFFLRKVSSSFENVLLLNILDVKWREHILNLDYLKKSIHLRGYAAQDPKNEYKKEAFLMFETFFLQAKYEFLLFFLKLPVNAIEENVNLNIKYDLNELSFTHNSSGSKINSTNSQSVPKTNRNDLCLCNSGKKYKHCHGKNL